MSDTATTQGEPGTPDHRIDEGTARALLVSLGAARSAIGVLMLAAPTFSQQMISDRSDPSAAWAMRMVGGRELAIGVGGLLSSRRAPRESVRGFLAAGALADLVDGVVMTGLLRTGHARPFLGRLIQLTAYAGSAAGIAGVAAVGQD